MNKLACSHISLIKGRKKPSIDSVTKKKKNPQTSHLPRMTICGMWNRIDGCRVVLVGGGDRS